MRKLTSIPVLSPSLRRRRESFGELLYGASSPQLCANKDGVRIIDLINGERSLSSILEVLSSENPAEETSSDELEERLSSFMHICEKFGILSYIDGEKQ